MRAEFGQALAGKIAGRNAIALVVMKKTRRLMRLNNKTGRLARALTHESFMHSPAPKSGRPPLGVALGRGAVMASAASASW